MAEKEKRVLEDLFLREKPARILLGMKTKKPPVYATVLSKEADCTYSHTIKILELFKEMGIVTFEKKGRVKHITLTKDGLDIAQDLEGMVKKLDQLEDGASRKPREKKKSRGKK